jgi:cytochrome P450
MPQPRLQSTKATGVDKTTLIGRLARNAKLVRCVARLAARFAPAVLTFRNTTLVFRWADVAAVCEQDAAFLIAPVNQPRIENVSGPFILGMDRSDRLFQQRQQLYSAMHHADMAHVRNTLEQEAERQGTLALQQGDTIDVVNSFARPVAGRVAVALFGIAGPSEHDLLRVARAIFHETFLNLGGDTLTRDVGVAAGRELRDWISTEIAARRRQTGSRKDVLGGLLLQVDAGQLMEIEAANIVSGLLVGAIDTTATCVANIMEELVSNAKLLARVQKDRDNPERIWGWCQEILRRRPHNPLVVREAAAGATIAGHAIPKGNRVFAVTLSAMQDARVFDHPARLDPTRPERNYLHFGRGLHLCAGRDLNAIQITYLVGWLLQYQPKRRGTLKFQGPFPEELVIGLERQTP